MCRHSSLYGVLCCHYLHLSCNAQGLRTKTCTWGQGLWDQVKSMSLNMGENRGCFIFVRVSVDAGVMRQKIYMHIYFFFSQAKSVSCCSNISDKICCQDYSQTVGYCGDNRWLVWSRLCFSILDNQKGEAIIDSSSQSQRQKLIRWILQKLSWYQMKLITFCSSIMPGTDMHSPGWETSLHQNASSRLLENTQCMQAPCWPGSWGSREFVRICTTSA